MVQDTVELVHLLQFCSYKTRPEMTRKKDKRKPHVCSSQMIQTSIWWTKKTLSYPVGVMADNRKKTTFEMVKTKTIMNVFKI